MFRHCKTSIRGASHQSRDDTSLAHWAVWWEFSTSREIRRVSHACCCGVCPFLSLTLPPFHCTRHPPPFSLSLAPSISSLLLLSRRLVGSGREDLASLGVLVRVCGRWRLLWQGKSEIQDCCRSLALLTHFLLNKRV